LNIRWARSATKHQVSRFHSGYVIERCGLIYVQPPPAAPGPKVDRLVYLGDDPMEVMAVGLADGDVLVIHAMPLREKYRRQYLEAMKWQR
jgi:hypothetical protein